MLAFPELCANPRVLAVIVLGSAMRPVETSYDLDCLYVYTGERPATAIPTVDVDVRGFAASEVDDLIVNGQDLLIWSIRMGQMVCECDRYWTRLREHWLPRLPFPSAAIADARAVRAERLLTVLREIGDHDATVEQLITVLTHRARAALLRWFVFPASRPELPKQLRQIGNEALADALDRAIRERNALVHLSAAHVG